MRWFFFLLLAACSASYAPRQNRLRISFNTEPTTLDPRKAGDFVSSTLICMTYEGLTRALPGGAIEPAVAEQMEISPDQTVYTFHLRRSVWSDRTPITAYDFERSWKEALSSPILCTYLFYPIKNAERCAKGEVSPDKVGIRALDSRTLCIELEHPTPYFYSLTAFPTFFPTPPREEHPPICNGPFCIQSMTNYSEIVLAKNPTFWNRDEIFLDEIHISIVPDETTALQMFEQGDLDWIGGPFSPLPPDALEKLKDRIIFIPNAATTLCTFNTQTFPFSNLHLRKAFSYAIDRGEIVEQLTQGGQIFPTSFLPPSLTTYRSVSFSDPAAARRHFEQALEEMQIPPHQLESLVLYYKPTQMEKRLAQTLQRQWKEVLGITIGLSQLDFKSHAYRLQNRDYQISLTSWIAQFNDPISILERFKDKAHLKNYPGWEDPDYTLLVNKANCSDQRLELLHAAEALLIDQMPLTPIYHWSSPALCSPRIQATATTPCGGVLFERFRLSLAKKK